MPNPIRYGHAAAIPEQRSIVRVFPIGLREGAFILIAICDDDTIWELDRRGIVQEWQQLPGIPSQVGAVA